MVAGEPLRRVDAPTPRLLCSPPLAKVQSHSHHLLGERRGLGARRRHLRRVARKNSVVGSVLSLGNALQDYEYDSDQHELPRNSGTTNVEEVFHTLFR